MNDPFEQHGIDHLSASSINEYIANPSRWILRVSGFRDDFGSPAMWRGIALDQAITKMLFSDLSDLRTIQFALEAYRDRLDEAVNNGIPVNYGKAEAEQHALEAYMHLAIPHYRQLGTPTAAQQRIKLEIEELPIPIIGYTALTYPNQIRDMKTVSRMPSEVPDFTLRQMAIYSAATGIEDVQLDYIHVTKTKEQLISKKAVHLDRHLMVVKRAALNMMRLLSISPDIADVAQVLMPDLSDWRWSDAEREAARKLWRIN